MRVPWLNPRQALYLTRFDSDGPLGVAKITSAGPMQAYTRLAGKDPREG